MNKIITFLKTKRALYGLGVIVIVIVGVYFLFFHKNSAPEVITAEAGDFLQQVSVSGKVVSTQNLDLSFEQSGIVRSVAVKVGDTVSAGKFIASQDTSQLSTQLAEMQAGIDVQKAKLEQLLAGASDEDVKAAENSLASANQDLVNSYKNTGVVLANSYNAIYNAYTVALYTQNTYFFDNDQQGLRVADAKNALNVILQRTKADIDSLPSIGDASTVAVSVKMTANLDDAYNQLKIIREQCDMGQYYLRVSSTDKASLDTQKTSLSTALANVITAQKSIDSYKSAIVQAENTLNSVSAVARITDVAVFEAQIRQAEASAQSVAVQIRKRQIYSPISGVITAVDAKVGSILSSGQTAVSLISSEKFQIEAFVPEIYISQVKVGDKAEATFDAYGAGKIFTAKVIFIEPAETVKDGVSTYKVRLELNYNGDEIRNGMTANVIITTDEKSNVIAIPQGLVKNTNGKKVVMIQLGEDVIEREVQVGNVSLAGKIEIISGLMVGDILIVE